MGSSELLLGSPAGSLKALEVNGYTGQKDDRTASYHSATSLTLELRPHAALISKRHV